MKQIDYIYMYYRNETKINKKEILLFRLFFQNVLSLVHRHCYIHHGIFLYKIR